MLGMVGISPWLFGSVEPEHEFLLYALLAAAALLWAVRLLVRGVFGWPRSAVLLLLAGLVLLAAVQQVQIPKPLMRVLSPRAAELYEKLLPGVEEQLPYGLERIEVSCPARWSLSLYPFATRVEMSRLIAAFLLFALVRANLAGAAALRRLCVFSLANAVLLAYLGLAQFFSSPLNVVYWSFPTPGHVFGPFINRNHFAFYANLCFGLGLGLLLYLQARTLERASLPGLPLPFGEVGLRQRVAAGLSLVGDRVHHLLSEPGLLWTVIGLATVMTAVAFSLSRGGAVAFFAAGALCGLVRIVRARGQSGWDAALLTGSVALALICWFGIDPVVERLQTLKGFAALKESRAPLWSNIWPAGRDFLLLGAGYGVFPYIEPLYRVEPTGGMFQHGHNEYLEALIEGGLLRLGLMLAAAAALFAAGYRALGRWSGSPLGCLVLGMLFALGTALLHSAGEFAVHVPAVAVLLVVIAAHLSAADRDWFDDLSKTGRLPFADCYEFRPGRLAAAVGVLLIVALTVPVVLVSLVQVQVEQARRQAWVGFDIEGGEPDQALRRFALVGELGPEFGRAQLEIASAYLAVYERRQGELEQNEQVSDEQLAAESERLERRYLLPALRHYLAARDICPLFGEPQMRLAAFCELLERADPPQKYLARAKLLVPTDPELWYLCGVFELLDGLPEEAWRSWRRSLELSDRFLVPIVTAANEELGVDGLLRKVLPADPKVIIQAAFTLFGDTKDESRRRLFLQAAQAAIEHEPPEQRSAEEWRILAVLLANLGRDERAIDAYQRALRLQPEQLDWRYELAELYYKLQRIEESHRELVRLLRQQPNHGQANRLYQAVSRIRAEKR